VTSKERLMCALNKEKPDRLPVSVHQWQGYHLDTFLDGISDVEAFKKFGMDGQIQYFEDMGQFWLVDADYSRASTPEWRDEVEVISADPENRINHHTITTPEGVLTYKTGGDRKTTWITEYLIKRDEDLELIRKYMPVPKLDLKPLEAFYANVGDAGIVRGFVWGDQAGCWQHAACLKDITELILKAMDDPAWVHHLLQILLDKKLEFVESMKGAKFDLVENGGGSGSSTLISPDMHQEPCEYKEKIGRRVALIGGMDQFNVLTRGTGATIRGQAHKLFEKVGYDGGYILSCADHFFETPVENIKAYAEAARECVCA
jgi:uroporphyrinogen decarboxylase